jgi:hypothetical protein
MSAMAILAQENVGGAIGLILVVFFLHFIGALLYFFLARQRRRSPAAV